MEEGATDRDRHADPPARQDPGARGELGELDVATEEGVGRWDGDGQIDKRETDVPELLGGDVEPEGAADLDVAWPGGGLEVEADETGVRRAAAR